jgi:hypothetical protein
VLFLFLVPFLGRRFLVLFRDLSRHQIRRLGPLWTVPLEMFSLALFCVIRHHFTRAVLLETCAPCPPVKESREGSARLEDCVFVRGPYMDSQSARLSPKRFLQVASTIELRKQKLGGTRVEALVRRSGAVHNLRRLQQRTARHGRGRRHDID